jgi:hypothetical protein
MACGSTPEPAGPGLPADVASIRLFDSSGGDVSAHIVLVATKTQQFDVRMYAANGAEITSVAGGVQVTFTFTPSTIATVAPVADEPLRKHVTTTGPKDTPGSLTVELLFPATLNVRTFPGFQCLVH